LLVGSYAIHYYLPQSRRWSMTETLTRWREFLPEYFVLPHPSWHTIAWLRNNPWFARKTLPELRVRVGGLLDPEPLNLMPRSAACPRH
jgi:uracil-DNA glycosylase